MNKKEQWELVRDELRARVTYLLDKWAAEPGFPGCYDMSNRERSVCNATASALQAWGDLTYGTEAAAYIGAKAAYQRLIDPRPAGYELKDKVRTIRRFADHIYPNMVMVSMGAGYSEWETETFAAGKARRRLRAAFATLALDWDDFEQHMDFYCKLEAAALEIAALDYPPFDGPPRAYDDFCWIDEMYHASTRLT